MPDAGVAVIRPPGKFWAQQYVKCGDRRALLDMAQDSPLNNSGPGPAWDGILEPRLNPKSRVSSAAGAKLRDDRPTQAKM